MCEVRSQPNYHLFGKLPIEDVFYQQILTKLLRLPAGAAEPDRLGEIKITHNFIQILYKTLTIRADSDKIIIKVDSQAIPVTVTLSDLLPYFTQGKEQNKIF